MVLSRTARQPGSVGIVRCTLCTEPRRRAIETACNEGDLVAVALSFGVSERALRKHIAAHPRAAVQEPSPKAKGRRRASPASDARPTPQPEAKRARGAPAPTLAPPPAASAPAVLEDEDDEEEAPITSRSPSSRRSARAGVEAEIKALEELREGLKETSVQELVTISRALTAQYKVLGQLTGELGASDTSIAASPHYRRIRSAIIDALRALDDGGKALRAVENALAALEPTRAAREAA